MESMQWDFMEFVMEFSSNEIREQSMSRNMAFKDYDLNKGHMKQHSTSSIHNSFFQ